MSHARSAVWHAKAQRLPGNTAESERLFREAMARERLMDWLDVLADHADEWRRFEPGYEGDAR